MLNIRPLNYVTSEDVEEPLTPSHILVGNRLITLPDLPPLEDPNYSSEKLTNRMNLLSRTLQHFWKRWKE